MEQLLLHLLGDFIIQNDWMALNKKKKTPIGFLACFIHSVTYSLPFLLITSWDAVIIIGSTHFIIDHTKIIDYIICFKNGRFNDIKTGDIPNFGFHPDRPKFISVWIYIFVDNTFHLIINYLAILYAS